MYYYNFLGHLWDIFMSHKLRDIFETFLGLIRRISEIVGKRRDIETNWLVQTETNSGYSKSLNSISRKKLRKKEVDTI
jgi:hypothetical protein